LKQFFTYFFWNFVLKTHTNYHKMSGSGAQGTKFKMSVRIIQFQIKMRRYGIISLDLHANRKNEILWNQQYLSESVISSIE